MFKCLKCNEAVSDGSRICRKCGSIIDEVPDVVEESTIVAEVVAEEEIDAEEAPPVESSRSAREDSPTSEKLWRCSRCSAEVPMHFLICWKCQHARNVQDSVQVPDPEPPIDLPVEAVVADAKLICPKCSSEDLVSNARIHVVAGGRLQVTLEAAEEAADEPGLLSANFCRHCGYVELCLKPRSGGSS